MKRGVLGSYRSRLSFLIRGAASSLVVASAAAVILGSGDIQQAGSDEFKRLIKQGDKFVKRGDLEAAEKTFRKASELRPQDSGPKLKLALVYVKQRRLRPAYDISFDIARSEPRNAQAFAVLGITLLNAGKFADARTVLFTALSLDRKEALAWAAAGMLDFYENRIPESLESLWQAVHYEPFEPDYLFAVAQVSARAERYKDAAEAYRRFLAVSNNTDDERRARIKGLIKFLQYLGEKQGLYTTGGREQTSVPFELQGNRPVIKLKVNGFDEPLNFVLDTGSGISVISDVTAKRLDIDPITRGGYAKGIGGNGRFEIVYGFLRQVDIGGVRVRSVPVYIRKFHSEGGGVDGYIGLSLISKFLTTIDYGTKTFSLQKKDGSEEITVKDDGVSLPLRLTSSGFLSGEVKLHGIEEPLNFIVDTGATISVISDEVASMEPISACAQNEKLRVVGSAGITNDVPSFLLPGVSFGSHSRKDVTAIALDLDMINEASGFVQAGILGGNFLKNFRMTFDFKNSKVTFAPVNAEP